MVYGGYDVKTVHRENDRRNLGFPEHLMVSLHGPGCIRGIRRIAKGGLHQFIGWNKRFAKSQLWWQRYITCHCLIEPQLHTPDHSTYTRWEPTGTALGTQKPLHPHYCWYTGKGQEEGGGREREREILGNEAFLAGKSSTYHETLVIRHAATGPRETSKPDCY